MASDDRFDDLERAIARVGADARADASRLAASMEALAKERAGTRPSSHPGWANPGPSDSAGPLPTVSEWFDQAAASHGGPVERAALAKGRWLATRAARAGRVGMEFEMSAVAFDGVRAGADGPARAARLEGVAEGSPLARFQSSTAVYFAAQPAADPWGSRWTLTAFASAADGGVGAALSFLAPDA